MIKLLRPDQIRQADRQTLEDESITSVLLMKRASSALFRWIIENYSDCKGFAVLCGPGNNGGDGLCLSLMLKEGGYKCRVYYPAGEPLSEDSLYYLAQAEEASIYLKAYRSSADIDSLDSGEVIIDALFGSGLNRPLEEPYTGLVQWMNQATYTVISVDYPSGLMEDFSVALETLSIVRADHTLSFQQPRLPHFLPEYAPFIGNWAILPIGLSTDFIESCESDFYVLEASDLKAKLRLRKRFDHKGRFGHGFLIAGSYGKMGAAVLAAEGALRTGIGLLTVHVPRLGYDIIQKSVPEAMASVDKYEKLISKIPGCDNYTAVAIGPGIGKSALTSGAIRELFERCRCPLVLDADALNLIAEQEGMLELMPQDCILTPHIKEFDRLVGDSANHFERIRKQMAFAREYGVVVVLKGAYTSIAGPEGNCYFNTSGNPGLAKGGSGDLLTGMVLAFLAQGYCSMDSAQLAVHLHGLAADFAVEDISEESLLPSEVASYISEAFKHLKNA